MGNSQSTESALNTAEDTNQPEMHSDNANEQTGAWPEASDSQEATEHTRSRETAEPVTGSAPTELSAPSAARDSKRKAQDKPPASPPAPHRMRAPTSSSPLPASPTEQQVQTTAPVASAAQRTAPAAVEGSGQQTQEVDPEEGPAPCRLLWARRGRRRSFPTLRLPRSPAYEQPANNGETVGLSGGSHNWENAEPSETYSSSSESSIETAPDSGTPISIGSPPVFVHITLPSENGSSLSGSPSTTYISSDTTSQKDVPRDSVESSPVSSRNLESGWEGNEIQHDSDGELSDPGYLLSILDEENEVYVCIRLRGEREPLRKGWEIANYLATRGGPWTLTQGLRHIRPDLYGVEDVESLPATTVLNRIAASRPANQFTTPYNYILAATPAVTWAYHIDLSTRNLQVYGPPNEGLRDGNNQNVFYETLQHPDDRIPRLITTYTFGELRDFSGPQQFRQDVFGALSPRARGLFDIPIHDWIESIDYPAEFDRDFWEPASPSVIALSTDLTDDDAEQLHEAHRDPYAPGSPGASRTPPNRSRAPSPEAVQTGSSQPCGPPSGSGPGSEPAPPPGLGSPIRFEPTRSRIPPLHYPEGSGPIQERTPYNVFVDSPILSSRSSTLFPDSRRYNRFGSPRNEGDTPSPLNPSLVFQNPGNDSNISTDIVPENRPSEEGPWTPVAHREPAEDGGRGAIRIRVPNRELSPETRRFLRDYRRMAEQPGHPLSPESQEFIDDYLRAAGYSPANLPSRVVLRAPTNENSSPLEIQHRQRKERRPSRREDRAEPQPGEPRTPTIYRWRPPPEHPSRSSSPIDLRREPDGDDDGLPTSNAKAARRRSLGILIYDDEDGSPTSNFRAAHRRTLGMTIYSSSPELPPLPRGPPRSGHGPRPEEPEESGLFSDESDIYDASPRRRRGESVESDIYDASPKNSRAGAKRRREDQPESGGLGPGPTFEGSSRPAKRRRQEGGGGSDNKKGNRANGLTPRGAEEQAGPEPPSDESDFPDYESSPKTPPPNKRPRDNLIEADLPSLSPESPRPAKRQRHGSENGGGSGGGGAYPFHIRPSRTRSDLMAQGQLERPTEASPPFAIGPPARKNEQVIFRAPRWDEPRSQTAEGDVSPRTPRRPEEARESGPAETSPMAPVANPPREPGEQNNRRTTVWDDANNLWRRSWPAG